MDMNWQEVWQTNSHGWRVACRTCIIEAVAHMSQMLKGGAGARGMLKAGMLPFLIHTVLKGRYHVAPRGTSAVPESRQAGGTAAGGYILGYMAGTEPLGISCKTKVQHDCFQ